MVSNGCLFIFAAVFLAMLMTISSAPVVDNESDTSEPDVKPVDKAAMTTANKTEKASALPNVITDKLLFLNRTEGTLDEDIQTGNALLFDKEGVTPKVVTSDDRKPFRLSKLNTTNTEEN